MQKTLGGDRLGSGKKMKVELHNYERSTHDLGYVWRSTMASGTLVPFMVEVALPGDTFDINLGCDVKTHPTVGPLFGSYKVQLDIFQAPIRLYNSALHNNALGIGRNMSTVKLPQIEFDVPAAVDIDTITDIDNSQVNPSSLPAYLGIKGIGWNTTEEATTRQFNAIPLLAYWEIYKNYYANKQEEIGAVIHTEIPALNTTVTSITLDPLSSAAVVLTTPPAAPVSVVMRTGYHIEIAYTGTPPIPSTIYFNTVEKGWITGDLIQIPWTDTGTTLQAVFIETTNGLGVLTFTQWRYRTATDTINVSPTVTTFTLTNIDQMRADILAEPGTNVFTITDTSDEPYMWIPEQSGGIGNIMMSQEGLAIKTYQSDLFNNWLKTENIDAISTATAIDTTGGSFTIDQLVLSKKVYNMLNRINVSGGSYDDWIDAVYVHDRYQRCESPMYMGGLIKELVFQEVVSNSESQTGQPLGTLAGKGTLAQKHKGGTSVIRVDEPSYIIGIVSLTPRIDYSQGNRWDVNLKTMDDFHKPALDEIGFQELITEQIAWWSTWGDGTDWNQQSAGKQPAWLNYMTNYNRTYGNFAIAVGGSGGGEMFMTLNRRYEANNPTLGDPLTIQDLTTYIDPAKFNFIFAETSLDAQNFWTQIAVDITARRKMSAKIMPNL